MIEWKIDDHMQAYTVTKDLGDMSINNTPEGIRHREKLAEILHTDLDHMIIPQQKHTDIFKEVTLEDGGTNMREINGLYATDATYTRSKGLWLLTSHADCTPVLIYDPEEELIAAIHSGWLGTTKEIVKKTVKHLIEHENCHPEDIYAYIGPCISKEAFEVQQDVIDKVQAMDFDTSSFYTKTDDIHYHVDNKGLNKQMLLDLGVPESHITVSPFCSVNNNDLVFSHRKNRDGTRSISIIKLI